MVWVWCRKMWDLSITGQVEPAALCWRAWCHRKHWGRLWGKMCGCAELWAAVWEENASAPCLQHRTTKARLWFYGMCAAALARLGLWQSELCFLRDTVPCHRAQAAPGKGVPCSLCNPCCWRWLHHVWAELVGPGSHSSSVFLCIFSSCDHWEFSQPVPAGI